MYRFEKLAPKINYILDAVRDRKLHRLRFVFDKKVFELADALKACDPESFSVMIDGGANHGQTSRAMLRINPKVRIIAFEPLMKVQKQAAHPLYVNLISKDLELLAAQYPQFKVFPVALSDKIGEMTLYSTRVDECSSLIEPPSGAEDSQYNVINTSTVATTTLDTLIKTEGIDYIDFLKLDLQGGELLALHGAETSLERTRYVLVEMNIRRAYRNAPMANEIAEFLHERGFIFQSVPRTWRTEDGSICQLDGLFARKR